MGTWVSADVSDYVQLAEQLDQGNITLRANMKIAMTRASVILERAVKSEIQKQRIVATGHYLHSIGYKRPVDPFHAAVGSNLRYAENIRNGRRAGAPMPPDAEIRAWAQTKGIPLQAVFPIRRAIARRGIKPRDVFTPAWTASQVAIRREMVDALMRTAVQVTANKGGARGRRR